MVCEKNGEYLALSFKRILDDLNVSFLCTVSIQRSHAMQGSHISEFIFSSLW